MRMARTLREQTGLGLVKVHDLALLRGVSIDIGHLSAWERGERELGDDRKLTLAAIYSDHLGRPITIDELIRAIDEPVSKEA